MRTEALFRVAMEHVIRGDGVAADAALSKAAALDGSNRHWSTAGRIGYLRARIAQQKGDLEGAKAGYAAVIREHLTAIRRAGAEMILTYAARDIAESLRRF